MRAIDHLHPAIRTPPGSGKTLEAFIALTIDWCAHHRGGGEPVVAGPRLGADLGRLDPEAIERLRREAWPEAETSYCRRSWLYLPKR